MSALPGAPFLQRRADGRLSRLAACAVAVLVARHERLKPGAP